MIEKYKKAVVNDLKDPELENFRNVRVVKYMDSFLIREEVDKKTSFGDYVGYKQFYGASAVVRLRREGLAYLGDEYMVNAGLIAACQGNN